MLIAQALRRSAQIAGNTVAVVCDERTHTWTEVLQRVARLAGALKALGLREGDRVAILSQNSLAYHEAYLALPWAGLVMTCLNVRWSTSEIADAIDDSEARALLLDDSHAHLADELTRRCSSLRFAISTGHKPADARWETLASRGEPVAESPRDPHDTAYLFFTGGTTGRAKGVMLTQWNIYSAALARIYTGDFSERSVIALSLPMFHVAGAAFIGAHLTVAGKLHLLPSFEPTSAMAAVEASRVTHVGWVPTMLSMVLNDPQFNRYDLSSLSRVFYGAAPMPQALLEQAVKVLPRAGFVQYYGLTESAASGTWLGAADHDSAHPARLHSAGRATPGAEIRIVRSDGSAAEVGETGEICIRAPMVTKGYWRCPEQTASILRDGWLHTGDVGFMQEGGYLRVVDRLKDMIISGGENVYSVEVEGALFSHPAVRECAVIGLPDDKWGEIVCAIVYLAEGAAVNEADLQAHCRSLIGGYKIPRRIVICAEPLPKSAAGKILKRELRRQFRVAS